MVSQETGRLYYLAILDHCKSNQTNLGIAQRRNEHSVFDSTIVPIAEVTYLQPRRSPRNLNGNTFDLHVCVFGKCLHRNTPAHRTSARCRNENNVTRLHLRPCRFMRMVSPVITIGHVHLRKIRNIAQKNVDFNYVVEVRSCFFEHRSQIGDALVLRATLVIPSG